MSRDPDSTAAQPFLCSWRITDMELWDEDAYDMLGPAHFTFGEEGLGNFCFVAVQGDVDACFGEKDGTQIVEFSWAGDDDGEPSSGRGWASIEGDTLTGRIFIHRGDDSAFTARREPKKPKPTRTHRKPRGDRNEETPR